jgi:phage tail sheath gpL-like
MPITNINITNTPQNVQNQPQKILFIGQMTDEGSATPGILVQNIDNTGAQEGLFGENSHIANMIMAAKAINTVTQMDAIPLADAGGSSAASGVLLFTGTATASGSFTVAIGSSFYHSYTVSFAVGATAAEANAALVAAINADPSVMVTASSGSNGIVNLTAVNAGSLGNHIGLQITGSVPGLTLQITEAMTGGSGDPVLTDIFDQIANIRYQTIVYPSNYSLSALQGFLDPRFNASNKILDGVGIITRTDTYNNLSTLGNGLNDKNIVIIPNASIVGGPGLTALAGTLAVTNNSTAVVGTGTAFNTALTPPQTIFIEGVLYTVASVTDATHLTLSSQYQGVTASGLTAYINGTEVGPAKFEFNDVFSAEFGAIRALRLTQGASIAQYVVAPSALDAFGGPAIASLPYFNTPMYNIPLSTFGYGFNDDEIAGLLDSGISVIGDNQANTQTIMGQMVTTYKTDASGNPDVTFKFLEYVDTASNIREYFFNNLKSNYSQSRLTLGDLIPGYNMANQQSIAAFCVGLYADLAGEGFVLTQAGEQALTFFKNNLQVNIDLSQGLATVYMITPIVTQLRQINVTMQIAFSTQS